MTQHIGARRIFRAALVCAGVTLGACAQVTPAPAPAPAPALAAAQPAFKATWVTTDDGTRLSVREYGNPQGPAIVFVHGIAQSQLSFGRQMRAPLTTKYRLITYDLRGHGESDKPLNEAAYTSGRRMSDDLQAVITATRAEKPVLVGWSLGGIVWRST